MEYVGHSHLAILDCAASIAIATKGVWKDGGSHILNQQT